MAKGTRIDLPGGGVGYSIGMTDKFDQLKRKMVFDQYAEKVVYYQRFVKTAISDNMAKGFDYDHGCWGYCEIWRGIG